MHFGRVHHCSCCTPICSVPLLSLSGRAVVAVTGDCLEHRTTCRDGPCVFLFGRMCLNEMLEISGEHATCTAMGAGSSELPKRHPSPELDLQPKPEKNLGESSSFLFNEDEIQGSIWFNGTLVMVIPWKSSSSFHNSFWIFLAILSCPDDPRCSRGVTWAHA